MASSRRARGGDMPPSKHRALPGGMSVENCLNNYNAVTSRLTRMCSSVYCQMFAPAQGRRGAGSKAAVHRVTTVNNTQMHDGGVAAGLRSQCEALAVIASMFSNPRSCLVLLAAGLFWMW